MNLDFEVEPLYQDAHTQKPNGFVDRAGHHRLAGQADGFEARFEVTRSW